jgi:hypothetical protein
MRYFTLAALIVAAAAPALAHHSYGMFDTEHPITLDATVKTFEWVNPHARIVVLRKSEGGAEPELWNVELTSPGNLTRMGWSKHTVAPGDHVMVEVSPLRTGGHGGGFRKLTLDDGQVLKTSSLLDIGKPGLE